MGLVGIRSRRLGLSVLSAWLLGACAAEQAAIGSSGPFTGTPGPSTGTGDGDGDSINPGEPGDGDTGPINSGDGDGFELPGECASSSVTAPPAASPYVDIVWVIDASGSMLDEQKRVTDNLTQFANDITAAAIDVRILMLTKSPADWVVCVYPDDPMQNTPLASDPRYKFVKTSVSSHNALQIATDRYDSYKDFLRPGSAVNFVFLTDDESNYKGLPGPSERAKQFQTDMTALLGRPFVAHTISSPGPTACTANPCNPDFTQPICGFAMLGCGAAAPGATYYSVAQATGGLTASICETDWTKIFVPLKEAVISSAPLPCDYDIPDAPPGQNFDQNLVNVGYTPTSGPSELVPNVLDSDACGDKVAWHYNENVSKVILCPSACNHVSVGGTLDIAFGCETVQIF